MNSINRKLIIIFKEKMYYYLINRGPDFNVKCIFCWLILENAFQVDNSFHMRNELFKAKNVSLAVCIFYIPISTF